jgi:hypothetical protein
MMIFFGIILAWFNYLIRHWIFCTNITRDNIEGKAISTKHLEDVLHVNITIANEIWAI